MMLAVVGAVGAISAAIIGYWCYWRRRGRKSAGAKPDATFDELPHGGTHAVPFVVKTCTTGKTAESRVNAKSVSSPSRVQAVEIQPAETNVSSCTAASQMCAQPTQIMAAPTPGSFNGSSASSEAVLLQMAPEKLIPAASTSLATAPTETQHVEAVARLMDVGNSAPAPAGAYAMPTPAERATASTPARNQLVAPARRIIRRQPAASDGAPSEAASTFVLRKVDMASKFTETASTPDAGAPAEENAVAEEHSNPPINGHSSPDTGYSTPANGNRRPINGHAVDKVTPPVQPLLPLEVPAVSAGITADGKKSESPKSPNGEARSPKTAKSEGRKSPVADAVRSAAASRTLTRIRKGAGGSGISTSELIRQQGAGRAKVMVASPVAAAPQHADATPQESIERLERHNQLVRQVAKVQAESDAEIEAGDKAIEKETFAAAIYYPKHAKARTMADHRTSGESSCLDSDEAAPAGPDV